MVRWRAVGEFLPHSGNLKRLHGKVLGQDNHPVNNSLVPQVIGRVFSVPCPVVFETERHTLDAARQRVGNSHLSTGSPRPPHFHFHVHGVPLANVAVTRGLDFPEISYEELFPDVTIT